MTRFRIPPSRPQGLSNNEEPKRTTYDEQSGLVYSEVSCRGGPMRADWVWKTRGSVYDAKHVKALGPGCASLKHMAIRCVLVNSASLVPETFENVPWEIAELVWKMVLSHQLDSLHAWKVFAMAYPGEIGKILKHRQHVIPIPDMALASYIRPVASVSLQWMTFLTLSVISCSRLELINISKLHNVGVLTIDFGVRVTDGTFDESIVRAWARAATEAGAFSMLRVLACRSQLSVLSSLNLSSHLQQFPLLSLFIFEDYSFVYLPDRSVWQDQGWRYMKGKSLLNFLLPGGLANVSWDSIVHSAFEKGGGSEAHMPTQIGPTAVNDLPRLHLSLGGVPAPSILDSSGFATLRCFQKVHPQVLELGRTEVSIEKEEAELSSNHPKKKAKLRIRNPQALDEVLSSFG